MAIVHEETESGLAYGLMMLALYFAAAIVFWFGWIMILDTITQGNGNVLISTGMVSQQTATISGFVVNIVRYAPPLFLLLGFIYAVNRSIFTRTGQ